MVKGTWLRAKQLLRAPRIVQQLDRGHKLHDLGRGSLTVRAGLEAVLRGCDHGSGLASATVPPCRSGRLDQPAATRRQRPSLPLSMPSQVRPRWVPYFTDLANDSIRIWRHVEAAANVGIFRLCLRRCSSPNRLSPPQAVSSQNRRWSQEDDTRPFVSTIGLAERGQLTVGANAAGTPARIA